MSNTKSKNKPSLDIPSAYWHYLLTHGKRPASVYAFAHEIGVEETEFYSHSTSFEALESRYWKATVVDTIAVLNSDEDYSNYPPDQQLLAFLYTYFSHIQKHRSRLVEFFPKPGCYKSLQSMRNTFIEHTKEIIAKGIEDSSIADRKKLTEKYPHLLFEQFRGIIEFYRNDQSEAFQDTDAFIEKSVRFSADLASSGTLDSAFDLGRFLLRRITLSEI